MKRIQETLDETERVKQFGETKKERT